MSKLNKIYCFALLCIVITFSCSDTDVENIDIFTLYEEKIEQILDESDIESQRLMYSLLDANDKYKYWTSKMDSLLANKALSLVQVKYLKDLKQWLNPTIFDNHYQTDDQKYKRNKFTIAYLDEALLLFDDLYIYKNFYTLETQFSLRVSAEDEDADDDIGGTVTKNCTCSLDSYFTCGIGTTIECGKIKCNKKDSGCGWLWTNPCNGRCLF